MPRPVRRHRPTTAIVVCVALAVWASGCSGDDAPATTTSTTEAATTTSAGLSASAEAVGLRDLSIGQCFDLPRDDPEASDRAVWVVPCADPHTHEVYSVVAYEGPTVKGGAYPGTAVVQDWAEQTCYAGFEAFVGRPWTESSYDIESWWPSQESWGRRDRDVICTTFPTDGSHSTGSAAGTKR